MPFWLHHDSALQTVTDDLDHVEPNQFAFNPVTLADSYDKVGCVGTFTPTDAAENWFGSAWSRSSVTVCRAESWWSQKGIYHVSVTGWLLANKHICVSFNVKPRTHHVCHETRFDPIKTSLFGAVGTIELSHAVLLDTTNPQFESWLTRMNSF